MKQYRNKILLIVLVGILLLINLPFHAILQTASMGGDAEQAVTQLFEKNATATDTDADRATPEDADRATVKMQMGWLRSCRWGGCRRYRQSNLGRCRCDDHAGYSIII